MGGNESATKYFQSNGGTAALASKDAKVKYTSNAANKYKEELKRRAARDAEEYPEQVVITDDVLGAAEDGTSTPAAENGDDDFFSSWDKPAIKRPSNPPSRVGTPPVISRTGSPFLSAPNGAAGRPKSPSPLNATSGAADAAESSLPAPTAIRASSATAMRKPGTAAGAGPRKNILGAKTNKKLGAKKVVEDIDFDAAEKAAKAEAERIEKLGYDPEAEKTAAEKKSRTASIATPTGDVKAPTPLTPSASAATKAQHQRSPSDVERLGMGAGRLGFGMTGKPAAAPAPRKLGFGSVGVAKPTAQEEDEELYARQKFSNQKSISSDEFFGKGAYDPNAQAEAKTRLQGFEGATGISSNMYFGRPEDDIPEAGSDDLEGMAKDFVRKMGITAGDDLENLISAGGEGARRLRGAVGRYLNS